MDFEQFMQNVAESYDHPEAVARLAVDGNLKRGLSPLLSHEIAKGNIDLKDAKSKGALAATLGRLQKGPGPRSPEVDTESQSIYAQDKAQNKEKHGKQ